MVNGLHMYTTIISKTMMQFATYRTNIISGVVSALFMLGARFALWLALFATGNAGGVTLTETMTYFVVMGLLMVWVTFHFSNYIGSDIRSGDIAQRLTRPFSYHFQLLAQAHSGAAIGTLTNSLPILIVAAIFIGILPPASAGFFGVFVLAALLGGVIYTLVDLIISYTAFWLTDYWYIHWYKRSLFTLFGGTMLPLWFYPEWLLAVCEVLPFQFALFIPMEIYLGRVPWADIPALLGMQLFWIGVLFALERLVWYRAQHKLVVQGG